MEANCLQVFWKGCGLCAEGTDDRQPESTDRLQLSALGLVDSLA